MDTSDTPTPQPSDVSIPTESISSSSIKLKRILCVEDEHFISELYTRGLKKAGYEPTVVTDGAEALKQALTNQFDIILLDIMLPTMTGIEILQKLRSPDVQPPLKAKIIIATNLEQKQEARAEIEKQADGYIVKAEVTPKQLVEFLHSFEP